MVIIGKFRNFRKKSYSFSEELVAYHCKKREHLTFIYVDLPHGKEEILASCNDQSDHETPSRAEGQTGKKVYLVDLFPVKDNGVMNALYSLSKLVLTGGDISLSMALAE